MLTAAKVWSGILICGHCSIFTEQHPIFGYRSGRVERSRRFRLDRHPRVGRGSYSGVTAVGAPLAPAVARMSLRRPRAFPPRTPDGPLNVAHRPGATPVSCPKCATAHAPAAHGATMYTALGPRRGHVAPAAAGPSHGDRTADSPHRPRGRKRRVQSVKRKVGGFGGWTPPRPLDPPRVGDSPFSFAPADPR